MNWKAEFLLKFIQTDEMKYLLIGILASCSVMSCSTKNKIQNLPKDASLKPKQENPVDKDWEVIEATRKKIDSLSNSVACTNSAEWRTSPLGSKPCGGPSMYIAYPIKVEDEILPLIQSYTQKQAEYNRKKGLMSDCAMVLPPAGIRCENGKAVLIKSSGGGAETL